MSPFTQTKSYLGAALSVSLVAFVIIWPMQRLLNQANMVMCFLLAVFLVALRLGRGPATLSAVLSVALFDFFFVPPHFSFAVADAQYLLTFAIMLLVALVTTHLTARIQEQVQAAAEREMETHRLYQLALELSGMPDASRLGDALEGYLRHSGIHAEVHLLDAYNKMPTLAQHPMAERLAHLALMQGKLLEDQDFLVSDQPSLLLPLRGADRHWGVMLARCGDAEQLAGAQDRLATVASVIGLTVERLHYVEEARLSQMQIAAERLRSSVLSALSHDLRTPLTSLLGLADSLALSREALPESARSQAQTIREQAEGMNRLMANLLDMARLQSGGLTLRREWQLFEDVVGASLKLMRNALAGHPIQVDLPPDLPLVEFDAVLLERVLCNLLDNAAKYSPPQGAIAISAWVAGDEACLAISDQGAGFPAGATERLFGLFERGEHESVLPGVGLGLSICRSIVEAHGGRISAENQSGGGARVTLVLPLGTPPAIAGESAS